MEGMLQTEDHRVNNTLNARFSTAEYFECFFAEQSTDLLRLSLHLTADAEKAERCLILAMRDCFSTSTIAKDRVYVWARRMVIGNAVRLIWGTSTDLVADPEQEFQLQPSGYLPEGIRESVAILALPELDRLAFVICILERYSILDCALLLRKTPREVHDAVLRAADQVVSPQGRVIRDDAATSSPGADGAFTDRGIYLDSSCGSLLEDGCQ
jgi:hypothetical protein